MQSQSSLFLGYFHIECDHGIIYSFKIILRVQNTSSLESCKSIRSEYPAYIDFGTSSTCVCVWESNAKRPQLLSFNNNADNGKKAFENPTSFIIYRWKKIIEKFNSSSSNEYSPVLTAGGYKLNEGNFDDYFKTNERIEFDSGHIVRGLLNKEPTNKQLKSIISRIRTIPYMLNQKQDVKNFFSYDDEDTQIHIISSIEKSQDYSNINPVVIYGYLLGKMINSVSDGRIYTDFRVSRPIKFPENVVEEIKRSLGYGLKLSVPYTLWDKVTIEMSKKNIEPVAYMGALIGDTIKVNAGEEKPFAVFDFGGGTLDTIFGILRSKNNKMFVDIYAQGGEETFGGESVIEKISFYLYSLNYQDGNKQLTGDDGSGVIPMRLPFGEEKPDKIPPELFSSTREATLNLQILGEKFSRHFFEDPDFNRVESFTVNLLAKDGTQQEDVKLSRNSDELDEYLYSVIKPRIETFATEMDIAFNECLGSEYDRSSVTIFKAGNASRNKTLGNIMDDVFSENKKKENILMPDDSSKEKFNAIYGITPKSAVALGQCYIKSKNITVNIPKYSPKWYVGYLIAGTGEFKHVLNKASRDNVWKKVEEIPENPTYTLSYTETLNLNLKQYDINVSADDYGKILFISIVNETEIKYCFAADEDDISETGSDNIIELI